MENVNKAPMSTLAIVIFTAIVIIFIVLAAVFLLKNLASLGDTVSTVIR